MTRTTRTTWRSSTPATRAWCVRRSSPVAPDRRGGRGPGRARPLLRRLAPGVGGRRPRRLRLPGARQRHHAQPAPQVAREVPHRDLPEPPPTSDPQPTSPRSQSIRASLARLGAEQRVLVLRYFADLSEAQIARSRDRSRDRQRAGRPAPSPCSPLTPRSTRSSPDPRGGPMIPAASTRSPGCCEQRATTWTWHRRPRGSRGRGRPARRRHRVSVGVVGAAVVVLLPVAVWAAHPSSRPTGRCRDRTHVDPTGRLVRRRRTASGAASGLAPDSPTRSRARPTSAVIAATSSRSCSPSRWPHHPPTTTTTRSCGPLHYGDGSSLRITATLADGSAPVTREVGAGPVPRSSTSPSRAAGT